MSLLSWWKKRVPLNQDDDEEGHDIRLPTTWPHCLRKTQQERDLEGQLEANSGIYADLQHVANIKELQAKIDSRKDEMLVSFFAALKAGLLEWNRGSTDKAYEFSCNNFSFLGIDVPVKFRTDSDSENIWSWLEFGNHLAILPSRDARVRNLYRQVVGMEVPFLIS